MPELPVFEIFTSAINSKFFGAPPRQIINVLRFKMVSGVISPTKFPFSTFQ
jgi:hypothetical protein